MKIFSISKDKWSNGLALLAESYRLFGPVKENGFHNFKKLAKGQAPVFDCLNPAMTTTL
jgi:hypothetical protein